MNKRLIIKVLGSILLIEALAMMPALIISFFTGDGDALPLLCSILAVFAICAGTSYRQQSGRLRRKSHRTDYKL